MSESKLRPEEQRAYDLLVARDEAAIEELQLRFGPWVLSMLRRYCGLLSETDLEEVYVEAATAVWNKFPLYDKTRGSLRTWIYRIARNKAVDRWRADTRLERRQQEQAELRGGERFSAYRDDVLAVLDEFKGLQRMILFADLQTWPWKIRAEVLAQRLDSTESSIYSQRNKAYRKLEQLIGVGRLRKSDVQA